ncbi:MAG TPA: hypothetical protein VNT60_10595, partial [Deinococcales bacterium]|nr:hypothetical protein [Deinococcales bacterium]
TGADALIPGLNLGLSFSSTAFSGSIFTQPFTQTVLAADATFTLNLNPFTITPMVAFRQVTWAPEAATFAPGVTGTANISVPAGVDNNTDFMHGVTVSTTPILFGASFSVGYSYDTTLHSATSPTGPTAGADWTASTFRANAAITFANFFGLDRSSFSVRYGFRQDINRSGLNAAGASANDAFGAGQDISGLYFEGNYAGLTFAYGIFAINPYGQTVPSTIWGQAIRLGYNFRF